MRPTRWAVPALAAVAAGVGVLAASAVLTGQSADWVGPLVGVGLLIGWSFLGVGVLAWRRRPDNRVGLLLCAVGFSWFAGGLWLSDLPVLHTIGIALIGLYYAVLVHMLLAFPSGRLAYAERVVMLSGYVVALGLQVAVLPFLDSQAVLRCDCPRNLLLVRRDDRVAGVLLGSAQLLGIALTAAAVVLLVRRWRRSGAGERRALAPVLWTGALVVALAGAGFAAAAAAVPRPVVAGLLLAGLLALAAVPYAFLAGLVRSRFFRAAAVEGLVTRLAERPESGRLRDALADAFPDPSVAVAYWLADRQQYVDEAGQPVRLPGAGSGRAASVVERGGRTLGAVVYDAALADEPGLVRGIGAVAAIAMENEQLSADLRARVLELERSRAQVLAAGDAERRRLERDLHDGAQQRLVALRLRLGMARAQLDGAPAGTQLDAALTDLDAALGELRALARGLHPSVLTTRGLAAAVRSLAERAPVPVHLPELPDGRLPAAVEAAAYFLVAESLTNVAKHAHATAASVRITSFTGRLLVEIDDDGRGGADPHGSGLAGLAARIAALDGVLQVGPGDPRGTRIRAEIPLGRGSGGQRDPT